MPRFNYQPRQPRPILATTGALGKRSRLMARSSDYAKVAHGLWAHGLPGLAPLKPEEIAALCQTHFGPNFKVAGFSAAHMYGFPIGHTPVWVRDALDIEPAVRAQDLAAAMNTPHLVWTEKRGHHRHDGLLVTAGSPGPALQGLWDSQIVSAVESLVAIEPYLSDWRAVACLDHLLGIETQPGRTRYRPWRLEQVHTALNAMRSSGAARLQRLLPLACARTWSPMETMVRLMAVSFGLPTPTMNLPVLLNDNGRVRKAHLDAGWEEQKVGVEYNGAVHGSDRDTYGDEMHRLELFRDHGWDIRVLVAEDMRNPVRAQGWLEWLAHRLL
ncbi:hypothetical protein [Kocuria sp.]|uniref:hypothetical protein n=1 Tax=Kocuria sp. TaxID=1871328 RepID=UPI0026DF37B8|nr:hypothetical protein [Kocuria sp.]MDO5617690.1 hypothetical protein [Kocuria sp.]